MYFDLPWFRPARRRLRLVVVVAVLLCTILYVQGTRELATLPLWQPGEDVVRARAAVVNPIYTDISAFEEEDAKNCEFYFEKLSELAKHGDILDLEAAHSHTLDITLYKKSRWVREQEKQLRREMRESGSSERWSAKHEQIVQKKYQEETLRLAAHEQLVIQLVNHMRVVNQCLVTHGAGGKHAAIIERKVYPWISAHGPVFRRWSGKTLDMGLVPTFGTQKQTDAAGTTIQKLLKSSNGRGIVIPVLPSQFRDKQVAEIQSLIRTLRAIQNKLPIEIVYRKEDLNQAERDQLVISARTDIGRFPYSYEWYQNTDSTVNKQFVGSRDYPKQDLWFVDVSNVINEKQHPHIRRSPLFVTHTFAITLASIFNSFDDAIVLLSSMLILKKDTSSIFNDPGYVEHGVRFFKMRSDYESKQRKSPPGFREITSLLLDHLMPNTNDARFFGLHKRGAGAASDRIFVHDFQLLQDPTMMVINKAKALSGLLLAANLQLYPLIHGRFPVAKEEINAEYFWLGQEVAGTRSKVNFNNPFAVVAGIPTPLKNRNFKLVTTSHELCSSSWGQLDPQDESELLYMTTHQLENYFLDTRDFKHSIHFKYTTKDTVLRESDGQNERVEEYNSDLAEKLERNPLYIEEIFKPVDILLPIIEEDFREPRQPWYKVDSFGNEADHPYWCAYDVVGSPERSERGRILLVNEKLQARYNFLAEVNMYKLEEHDG